MTVADDFQLAFEKLRMAQEAVEQMLDDDGHFVSLREERANHYSASMHATSMSAHIQGIYTNLESVIKHTLKSIDGRIPGGDDWHRALLRKAATAVEGERPPLIVDETFELLMELLGFRHVVRVNYGWKLKPAQVFENLERAKIVVAVLEKDLRRFQANLPGG